MSRCVLERTVKGVHKLLEDELNRNMNNINITRSQMDLIIYTFLKNKAGIEVNQVDIEKELNIKNPTVTGIINRLEKKDYIRREQSKKGSNFKSIVVTDKGIALINEGQKIADKVEKKVFSVLSKEEKEELIRLLSKVIDNKNYKR